MSKNICPCCKGKSEHLNSTDGNSTFLCLGCEIKMYDELYDIIDKFDLSKEDAYQYLTKHELPVSST